MHRKMIFKSTILAELYPHSNSTMSSSSSAPYLEIRDNYTAVSFVVFGRGGGTQTKGFMHLLKNPTGKSNFGFFTYKTDENGEAVKKPGYVYAVKQRERIGKLVQEVNDGKHKQVFDEPEEKSKKKTASDIEPEQPKSVGSVSSVDMKNYVRREDFMRIVERLQIAEQEIGLLRTAILNYGKSVSGKDEAKDEPEEADVQDDDTDDEETTIQPHSRRTPMWCPSKRKPKK